ncbi:hypothetical protein D3C87_184590 [compost metagenome]
MCKYSYMRKLCQKFYGKSLLLVLVCFFVPQLMFGTVSLPKLVANNMILQRGVSLPIWGKAAVGESVTVTFAGQTHTTVTPATGKWQITLTPLTAGGGSQTMVVTGTNTITLTNILIGDVYLASGQSNMELQFNYGTASTVYATEIAASANSNIRQFKITKSIIAVEDDVSAAPLGWQSAAPANMKNFSMVAYFFAKDQYAKYGIPIGIINSTYGGTIIEAWISHEGLINFPDLYNATPPPNNDTNPSILHNSMIKPLLKAKFKAFLWYQGESNTSNAFEYRALFAAFISDIRTKFAQPNLPFLFVQLANWSGQSVPQQVSSIAELRESQATALTIPNTGMAVAHETSLNQDIHPIQKEPVGERLSLVADKLIWNLNVAYQGPSYLSSTVVGNKMVVTFKNVGTGLSNTGTALNQFTIAGADKVYKNAVATITATNKVEVSATTVPSPMYVRYAWADNPRTANLYNSANLPAESFRSDQPSNSTLYTAQAFTAGNLVVTRYGSGATLPAQNTTIPVFLEEFNTAGVSQATSRAMPGVAGNYGAGITNLTAGTHSFGVEALLSLSENKKYLTFASNNTEVGLAVSAVGSKTIAILTADGALNTTTSANLGVARTATVNDDLSRIYYNSQTQGISYVPYGTANSNVVLAAGENGYRGIAIYNGQLYASTTAVAANGSVPAVAKQVGKVGTGMPTSGTQTLTPLPGLPTTEIVRQFVFLSTAGNTTYDLFYGVTESGKLIKYKLVSGNWVDRGSLNIANVVSITGKWNTNGTTQLYCTTLNASTYASNLVKVEDFPATSSTLATNAVTVIATAAANTYFKGVSFAPENSDITMLPMSVSSFNGSMGTQGVNLKWETVQEVNGDSFEVLRSEDGISFSKIGKVKAAGNSETNKVYSFIDFNPAKGVNYYKLNQVDKDGSKEQSKLVAVNAKLTESIFKIHKKDAANFQVTISALATAATKVIITDILGQKRYEAKVNLTTGINYIIVPAQNISKGIYILHSMIDGKKQSVKFYGN